MPAAGCAIPIGVRLNRLALIGSPSECWPWTGGKNHKGYGQLMISGKNKMAHRASYELWLAPIPHGLELDHLCRNRACINPAHLEPVTHEENIKRGIGGAHLRARTHCPQGHEYDAKNTYFSPSRAVNRQCNICRKVRSLAWYHKNKTALLNKGENS